MLAGIKNKPKETNKKACFERSFWKKCVCVLKIPQFKDKQGSAEISDNSFPENYSITQIKSRQKSQKHLEETAVPEHVFSCFGKTAASL